MLLPNLIPLLFVSLLSERVHATPAQEASSFQISRRDVNRFEGRAEFVARDLIARQGTGGGGGRRLSSSSRTSTASTPSKPKPPYDITIDVYRASADVVVVESGTAGKHQLTAGANTNDIGAILEGKPPSATTPPATKPADAKTHKLVLKIAANSAAGGFGATGSVDGTAVQVVYGSSVQRTINQFLKLYLKA